MQKRNIREDFDPPVKYNLQDLYDQQVSNAEGGHADLTPINDDDLKRYATPVDYDPTSDYHTKLYDMDIPNIQTVNNAGKMQKISNKKFYQTLRQEPTESDFRKFCGLE